MIIRAVCMGRMRGCRLLVRLRRLSEMDECMSEVRGGEEERRRQGSERRMWRDERWMWLVRVDVECGARC